MPLPRFVQPIHRLAARPTNGEVRTRATLLLGAGALAGAAFGTIALASARRRTVPADLRVHGAMRETLDPETRDAAEEAAQPVEKIGKWWVYGPVALAAALAVTAGPRRRQRAPRSRWTGAAVIVLVPALATALSPALDRWLPQPPVGPRRRPLDHPVFPSGHAFRATAVAIAAGYVLTREELLHPAVVWPVASVTSAAVGLGRLVREKHLASDIVGGWLAGIVVGTAAAGAYEMARGARRGPRRRR